MLVNIPCSLLLERVLIITKIDDLLQRNQVQYVFLQVYSALSPSSDFTKGAGFLASVIHVQGFEQTPGDSSSQHIAFGASSTLLPKRDMHRGRLLVETSACTCYSW
jgi:hypothetical protein